MRILNYFNLNYFTSKNNTTMKKASKVNMVPMRQVKPAPAHQGKIRLDERTEAEIPMWVKDIPAWEAKVREKHRNKDKVNAMNLLTGAAKNRVKEQL